MTDETITYRSPRSLSFWTILLLAANLGIFLISALLGFIQLLLPYDMALDHGEVMSIWLMFQGLLFLLLFPIRFATIIVFLIWLYRVYKNLTPLKASYTEYSPGWAVGYWFIPFVNLFRPYQVVQEVWRESDPDFEPDMNFFSANTGTNSLLIVWWLLFLASNVSQRFIDTTIESAEIFPIVAIIAGILTSAAAYLAILIVKDITKRQEERAQKISSPAIQEPPPPPDFNRGAEWGNAPA